MAREVKPLYVGTFIVICTFLLIISVFWIGFSKFFEKHKTYVTYFNESVKGLQKDAIVNYRGVPVGRVGKVDIAPNGRLVEVILYLKPDFPVDDSLVIRLREQGITGLRFLEIDTAPEDVEALTPKIDFVPPYPVIKSYPSEITALKRAAEQLYTKIISLDLETLVKEWQLTAIQIRKYLSEADISQSINLLKTNLNNLKTITTNVANAVKNHGLENILEKTSNTIESINHTISSFDTTQLNKAIEEMNSLLNNLNLSLKNFDNNTTSISIRLDKALSEMEEMLRTMKNQPGRLWLRPENKEPFETEREAND